MASRNRIIYASQSVIVGGEFLYRVQTLGSTTTFNSTDLFELGQQDILDVVDDVPTVAITLDTNDWGSCLTAAHLANVDATAWEGNATTGNANVTTVSGVTEIGVYHGVSLSHYGISGSEFDLWAPVQTEASLGTSADNIDQTMFMARCFVNGITLNYSVGGEATENYTAETDNKTWFLNASRFVSQEQWDLTGDKQTYDLGLADGSRQIPELSDNTFAFLYIDPDTARHSIQHTTSAGVITYIPVVVGAPTATEAGYIEATNVVTLNSGFGVTANGDTLRIRYAADAYADATGDSDSQQSNYFTAATDVNSELDHTNVGGLRQGQVEIYLVDPDATTSYEVALRLQSVNLAVTLNREALSELGHLKPYDRPVTFPIEITTTVETTAGDLETFAKFAGREAGFDAQTELDLTIDHLLQKDNLILVVQIFDQTDVEAGGVGANRLALRADLAGQSFWNAGQVAVYDTPIDPDSPDREYPLKTVVVPSLKATNESYSLAVGSNATQSFTFRSVNKFFMIKGFVPVAEFLFTPGMQKSSN